MFESIDTSLIDWSRAQFTLTAMYHWLFVPLTLGLAMVMGIMETVYYKTGSAFWKKTAQFWQKIFGINFAVGIATGIVLEFEFGTNWSNYSMFVGDIFGAPLAIEGILAFFMESTFVAVMYFGWNKVSKQFHLASTWLTGLGATISAWWILVANSWMQYPVGMQFNPDTVRNEMVDFLAVAFSPMAISKFFHTVMSGWVLGAIFVVGVSSWYLLKKRHIEFAKASIKIGATFGIVASLIVAFTGDISGVQIAKLQPMKMAAAEGLKDGGNGVPFTVVGNIKIPKMLSILATHDIDGYVPGINNLIDGGYKLTNGGTALSAKEKIERGKKAIVALATYRKAVKEKDVAAKAEAKKVLDENMQYFGYGYIKDADQIVPSVPVCFYAFRIMVGLGSVFILFFLVVLFIVYRKDITPKRWLQRIALLLLPCAYIASEAGWLVAEFGRQPWTIQDMMPTWVAVSDLQSGSVMLTFFIFLALFTTMLAVEVSILCKQIKKGPKYSEPVSE